MRPVRQHRRRTPVAPAGNAAVALGLAGRRSELRIAVHHEVAPVEIRCRTHRRQPHRARVEVPRGIHRDAEMRERGRHHVALVHRRAQRALGRRVARHDERHLAVLRDVAPVIEVDRAAMVRGQDDQPVLALAVGARLDRRQHAPNECVGSLDRREIPRHRAVKADRMACFVDISHIEHGEVERLVLRQRLHARLGLRRIVLRVLQRHAHIDRILGEDALPDRPPVAEVRGADRRLRPLGQREQRRIPLVVGDEEAVVHRTVLVRPHAAEDRRPARPRHGVCRGRRVVGHAAVGDERVDRRRLRGLQRVGAHAIDADDQHLWFSAGFGASLLRSALRLRRGRCDPCRW